MNDYICYISYIFMIKQFGYSYTYMNHPFYTMVSKQRLSNGMS